MLIIYTIEDHVPNLPKTAKTIVATNCRASILPFLDDRTETKLQDVQGHSIAELISVGKKWCIFGLREDTGQNCIRSVDEKTRTAVKRSRY